MANFNGRARANEITAGLKLYPKIEYCVRPQPKGTNVWQNYYFFDWLNHLPRNNNLCKDSIKFNKMLASHKKIKPYLSGEKCPSQEEIHILHVVYTLACSVNCNALKSPHPAAERGLTNNNTRNLTVREYQHLIHLAFEQYAGPDLTRRQEKKLDKAEGRAAGGKKSGGCMIQ